MKLDPRRVLIFRTVARTGSVSAAARELGWTQPAVSQHLRALEDQIGTPVFLRGATGVTINEAGERLLRHADAIASALQSAEADLEELVSGAGTVRLAAFPSAMADFVPAAIGLLAERAPAIRVRVTELEPPEANAATAASDVDLSLVFEYADAADEVSLETVTLGFDPSFAVVPLGHPLASEESIALAQLRDEHWVAGCPRCRAHLESLASAAGFSPQIQHETDDFHASQALVARTGSVTLLSGLALNAHTRDDVRVMPVQDDRGRRVMLRYRAGAQSVPAVALAIAAIRDAAADYTSGSDRE